MPNKPSLPSQTRLPGHSFMIVRSRYTDPQPRICDDRHMPFSAGERSELGHELPFAVTRNQVCNAAMNRHSALSVGNAAVSVPSNAPG